MQEEKRRYKVNVGDVFMIFRSDNSGYVNYKLSIKNKKYDGTEEYFYKEVRFKKDVIIENRTKIKIKDFFEIVRENKNDKYNPIWGIFITDFEIVGQDTSSALKEYREETSEAGDNIDNSCFPF